MRCTGFEDRLIEFLKKHMNIIFFIGITFCGCLLRYSGRNFLTKDMRTFISWLETLKSSGGLTGLGSNVGDYGIPFQIMMALVSYLPFQPLYSIKMLYIAFDFILAVVTGIVAYELSGKKRNIFLIGYAATLLSPNIALNSSVWGQCDAMYVSMLMIMLYFLIKEKYLWMFLFFYIALVFKLQAIFILPMLIILYFVQKRYSILNIIFLPIVVAIAGIVVLFFGRNIFAETIAIYIKQVNMYSKMYMNYQSIWTIFGDGKNSEYLKIFAFGMTCAVMLIGLYVVLKSECKLVKPKELCILAIWTSWSCILFLPTMHERYGYFPELMAIVLVILDGRYLWLAFGTNLLSTICYIRYLFKYKQIPLEYLGIANLILWVLFTVCIVRYLKKENEAIKEEKHNREKGQGNV